MSNTCKCPNPPGGEVICESYQVAICRVKDGVVQSQCLTPPKTIKRLDSFHSPDDMAFLQTLLTTITNMRYKGSSQRFIIENIINISREGYYNPTINERISLNLPIGWIKKSY